MRRRASSSLVAATPVGLALGLFVPAAHADAGAPSAALPSSAVPSAAPAPPVAPESGATCVEKLPAGKARPKLTESVPARGTSGHALTLTLTLEHGKGETVLPGGLNPQTEAAEWRALAEQGLYLPDPDGGAGPEVERTESGDRATTKLTLSFVPLPDKPGRSTVELPPLPISIARASGDVLVICTERHEITIEDPIANVPSPSPKPNPPARPEHEEWTALKHGVLIGASALAIGALLAWLLSKWLRRPRPEPPPPPARPPWEVALEELYDLRHAGLVGEGRFAEHFDRVSDVIRKYLGARFGFDGLESTTRETLVVLRRQRPLVPALEAIESFLRQADLVKFAKTVPSAEDCELALGRAERIVSDTLPAATVTPMPAPPTSAPPASPPQGESAPPSESTPEEPKP